MKLQRFCGSGLSYMAIFFLTASVRSQLNQTIGIVRNVIEMKENVIEFMENEKVFHVTRSKNSHLASKELKSVSSKFLEGKIVHIIFDIGPCYWVAEGTPVHGRSGGEYVWCKSILTRMTQLGRDFLVTHSSRAAKSLSVFLHTNGQKAITLTHWGWQDVALPRKEGAKSSPPEKSIGANCVMGLQFWGCDEPDTIWPGSLDRYLTIYPVITKKDDFNRPIIAENTATGLSDVLDHCDSKRVLHDNMNAISKKNIGNVSHGDLRIMGYTKKPAVGLKSTTPYYIIFGKFGSVVNADHVTPFLRNASIWNSLHEKGLHALILHCDERLLTTLQIPSKHIICLDEDSIFKNAPHYSLLIKRALFVLGVGTPIRSTTPFEAMVCLTSVILPVDQHSFLDNYTDEYTQFHSIKSSSDLDAAVDEVMEDNRKLLSTAVLPKRQGMGRKIEQAFKKGKNDLKLIFEKVEESCLQSIRT